MAATFAFALPSAAVAAPRRSVKVSAVYTSVEMPRTAASPSSVSFYDVLGVQMGATCQEIKLAYRRLARTSHPDVAPTSCGDEFMKIHAAYSTLSDPEKRADYDRTIFRRRRPELEMALSGVGVRSSELRFNRRTWETDQCW